MNSEVKESFTHGPLVFFRRVKKLGSYLVRVKLHHLERSVGSIKLNGKRCQVCTNVTEKNIFQLSH